MRDPQRLDEMYNKLLAAHKSRFSDWRLGQFLLNFLGWVSQKIDPFFPDDDALLKYLDQFIKGDKEPHDDRERGKPKERKGRAVSKVQSEGTGTKRVQKREKLRSSSRAKQKVQEQNFKNPYV